jgi:hypothetical protein
VSSYSTRIIKKSYSYNTALKKAIRALSPQAKDLARRLIENNTHITTATTKEDIEKELSLLEESIKIANSPDGLAMPVFNHIYEFGSNFEDTPAYDARTGKSLTKPVHDSLEIYRTLKGIHDRQLKEKQEKKKNLEEKSRRQWESFQKKYPRIEDRRDASTGNLIDEKYFLDNEYGCPYCSRRYKTENEVKIHQRQDTLYAKY